MRVAPDGTAYGFDTVDPLLWHQTRYLLNGTSHARAIMLLDEFLTTGGERLVADPLKRAVFQHDLWAIFDWLVSSVEWRGLPEKAAGTALMQRLARVIRRVALTKAQIEALPDTYAAAVASGPFVDRGDRAQQRLLLPPDLFAASSPWIAVGGTQPAAPQHADELGRSAFIVLWSVPGGSAETAAYLRKLWEFPQPYVVDQGFHLPKDGELRVQINPALPAVPDGTRIALVRKMMLIDNTGAIAKSFGEIPAAGPLEPVDEAVLDACRRGFDTVGDLVGRQRLRSGIAEAMRVVGEVNKYLTATEPYKMKDESQRERLATVLHVAAFNGHLDQVPPALLTVAALRETTSAGDTVFHAAAISGHLEQIPAAQLTRDNLVIASKSGFTAIHAAAETGQLKKIPVAQLTRELLLTRNDNGDTPLHAAAHEGHLDQVPPDVLTAQTAGTRNYDGLTVAQLALDRGHLDQIPPDARPKAMNPLRRFLHNLGRSKAPF